MTIYADYNGSAPVCQEVRDYLKERLENGPYANPNASHLLGQKTLMGMDNARSVCAKILGALPKQIIFNSGSTEGISQVFFSTLYDAKSKGKDTIIISGIEHSAVINCAHFYRERENFQVKTVPTLPNGLIDKETLFRWLNENRNSVALVAVMAANNETGVIQPYKEISKMCRETNVPYLCDTTQLIGKGEFNFQEADVDYAFLSGHKIGAMTGAGFLLAKDPSLLKPLVIGGGQENSLRGGTQNYLGNETLAIALKKFQSKMNNLENLRKKRESFESSLKKKWPNLVILGEEAPRLGGSTFLSLPEINGQTLQMELENQDIYVTTSSACSDNEQTTSKVLKAMGVTDQVGRGAVRISLGLCSPLEAYDSIEKALDKAFTKLSKTKNF